MDTSKAYGLPGLRIGWMACRDREVIRRRFRVGVGRRDPDEALVAWAR